MSNQRWQDGGMKTENGALEWGSDAGEFRVQNPESSSGREADAKVHRDVRAGGREARGGGKRRVELRVDLGKGGQIMRKRTGFSQLFPDDSMQVVDFPCMYDVRHFWGGEKEPQRYRGTEASRKQHGSMDTGKRRATERRPYLPVRILAAGMVTERAAKCT